MSKKIEEICRRSILRLYPRMSNNSVDFIINVFKRYNLTEKKENFFRERFIYLVVRFGNVMNSIEESERLGKSLSISEMMKLAQKMLIIIDKLNGMGKESSNEQKN